MAENSAPLSPSSDVAICVRNIKKNFGFLEAVRGVSFDLKKGEFLALFGPNGAGKTTLIRMLSALTRPTSGAASVAGFNVLDGDQNLRKEIGVISHSSCLYSDLSAFENMLFYAKIYGLVNPGERAAEVIEEAGLKARMYDRVRTFSRGMLQRLSIARATIHNPSVLFLDEPYTGLDQHASMRFKDYLKSLHNKKRTVLMTTHDISRGLEMCDWVAILVKGRLAYMQPAASIDKRDFEDIYFKTVEKNLSPLRGQES